MKNKITFLLCFLWLQTCLAQRSVIILIADDLGTDYLGFYSNHQDTVDVPNIRALLRKGVLFNHAMANPVCSATRAGLLSGRYSFRTGVGYIVGNAAGSGVLDTSEISIPKLLRQYDPGMACANIGKWHLHQPTPTVNLLNPLAMGYHHSEGPFVGAISSYTNWSKCTNGVNSTVNTYATTEHINNAVTWLRNQNAGRFFLWMGFVAPHAPYHLPPANLHSYTSLSGTTQDIQQNPKSYFKASLQALDTELGRLFDSLQVLNRLDSTDFIFMGDNGNTLQTAQIANVTRSKGTLYQYGVHVPFIIAGPSVVNPGRVSDALVNTVDVLATVQDLYGNSNWQQNIPSSIIIDSKSLLPVIKNLSNQIRPWAFTEVFKTIPDSNDGKAIRDMEFKLIRFDDGHEEFYHLSNDSLELNNLLSGNLDSMSLVHYNYLCQELSTLTNSSFNCSPASGYEEIKEKKATNIPYPNPFTNRIVWPGKEGKELQLMDADGKLIYSGNALESIDFSKLQPGSYYLKTTENPNEVHPLIKK